MAVKNICVVPSGRTLEYFLRHSKCDDGSHAHLSRAQVYEREKLGLVIDWVRQPTRRSNGVIFLLSGRKQGRAALPGSSLNCGLSYRVGSTLAIAVYLRHEWARIMLLEINMKPPGASRTA